MERGGQGRLEEQALHGGMALRPVSAEHQGHRSPESVEVVVRLPHHPPRRERVEGVHQALVLHPVVLLEDRGAVGLVGVGLLPLIPRVVPLRPGRGLLDAKYREQEERNRGDP